MSKKLVMQFWRSKEQFYQIVLCIRRLNFHLLSLPTTSSMKFSFLQLLQMKRICSRYTPTHKTQVEGSYTLYLKSMKIQIIYDSD